MKDIFNFFEKPKDPLSFSAIRISLASPEKIREWSHGEVKKPETINYRTFKPERDGLFCAKIFGPVKDYECNCGKYKRMKHRGVVCEKCGVEVIQSKVRRERLGHINAGHAGRAHLVPEELPSRIGNLLDITLKDLEKVLYCEAYVVIDPKETRPREGRAPHRGALPEAPRRDAATTRSPPAWAARPIRELLKRHRRPRSSPSTLRAEMREATSRGQAQEDRQAPEGRRGVPRVGNKPEWMMLDGDPGDSAGSAPARSARRRPLRDVGSQRSLSPRHQPQQPPQAPAGAQRAGDHHPQREAHAAGGRRRAVRQRPPRQDHHRSEQAPAQVALATCSRASRAASARTCSASASTTRAVRSSSSVPSSSCTSAVCRRRWRSSCSSRSSTTSSKSAATSPPSSRAKKMVEKERPEVWDILEEVIREHPVLLNRAPTLHRLGIQAFEPVLIEGKAIQLHPLVCAAFNADFDGDQMAVHVPLSIEAQMEARVLMMSHEQHPLARRTASRSSSRRRTSCSASTT